MIIPQTSRAFVYCCFRVVAAYIIIGSVLPKILVLLAIVLVVYYFIQVGLQNFKIMTFDAILKPITIGKMLKNC